MSAVQLFELASSQASWLSARQTAVANNIANANTPGYAAMDVEPFAKVLDSTIALDATTPGHFGGDVFEASLKSAVRENTDNPEVKLEEELVKSGEVTHAFELNTAIVKAFHRMMMMTVKS